MDGQGPGLEFVAFGCTPDAFEAQLCRMVGLDDGIPDALLAMSTTARGADVWCPPLHHGVLDQQALTG